MLGTRAIWHRGWKAATAVPASPASWGPFDQQRWELFDTSSDPSECVDLSAEHPDKLRELTDLWWAEAEKYQAFPLETRNAVEAFTTVRPQLSAPRERYIYYPGTAAIPESVAPNIRGRSFTIAAELEVHEPADLDGVLFAQGSRFGGHSLYFTGGRLTYVYNYLGQDEQIIQCEAAIPPGHVFVSASFEKQGDTIPTEGSLTLHIRDEQVAERRIHTQMGKFGLGGGGLLIAEAGVEVVTGDYPGSAPHALVGATLARVLIDVSGEPFVDLAREAAALYSMQ